MVHPGGRPRTTCLKHDDLIELGKEMVAWVKLHQPVHLSEWYTIHKGFIYNEWKQFIAKPEFHPYYETALRMVGRQYLTKESPIEPSLKQRWQRVYFKDLREEEDETARFHSDLKVEEVAKVSESDAQRASDVLSQLKAMQDTYRLTISQSNNSPAQ